MCYYLIELNKNPRKDFILFLELIMTMICIICFNNHAEDDCADFFSSSKMNGIEKKPSSSLTRNLSKYEIINFMRFRNEKTEEIMFCILYKFPGRNKNE